MILKLFYDLSFLKKQFLLILTLWFVYYAGHFIFHKKSVQKSLLRKAIVDSSCHMLIANISWLIFISWEKLTFTSVWETLLCGILASLIDSDHFVTAKSLQLRDAVNLPSRPFLHNSTLIVSLTVFFVISMMYIRCVLAERIGWIFLIAVISHHLRDSLHRGLLLWPYATQQIAFVHVLICTYFFPLGLGSLLHVLKVDSVVQDKPDILIV
ncbi:transmembrane protein 267-like [Uloborus diversus]|uniref:transmembrane protein 267-like n=1 Tax=Uloborus diversus TaxID=327109 RepID=UPI0024098247|nr:transmembrane protein 267-like [Uloborus diversus]